MKRLSALLLAAFVFAPPLVSAQLATTANAPTTPADRTKALHALFHDYWEENLKRRPEFASTLGDKRYNDQITDYSVKAVNDWLAAEQDLLMKLAVIDPAGLSDQDQTSRELLIRKLTDDQEGAEFKQWEIPIDQMGGIYSTYPNLAEHLSFTTAKDYDDWIARLRQIPHAVDQVTANMAIGIEDKRVPPKYLLALGRRTRELKSSREMWGMNLCWSRPCRAAPPPTTLSIQCTSPDRTTAPMICKLRKTSGRRQRRRACPASFTWVD